MDRQRCMTCQWYDEWFGVCCCGYSQWCADCPAEPEAMRCRFWAARDEGAEAVKN